MVDAWKRGKKSEDEAYFALADKAIELAQAGDLVVIAGKGHETYQLFADHRIDFDDREVARTALRRRR